MDFIKEWTLTICITLIISIIFSMITPKGNMGKFFKIILSTFIFLSFIYPLKNNDLDFSFPNFNIESFENQEQESYENLIETQINESLVSAGYNSCIIDAKVEYSNNEINIKKLRISVPDEYNTDDVKNYLFENLGLVAEVYRLGE